MVAEERERIMEFEVVAGDWAFVGNMLPMDAGRAIKALDDAGNIIIEIVPVINDGTTVGLLVRTGTDVKLPG
jgi:hypothetical protein